MKLVIHKEYKPPAYSNQSLPDNPHPVFLQIWKTCIFRWQGWGVVVGCGGVQEILPWVLLERQTGCAARQWDGWRKRRNTRWGHHTQCDWQAATQRSSVPLAEHATQSWSGTQRRCTERRKRLLTVRKSTAYGASPDGTTTSFPFPQPGQWLLFLFPKFSIGRLTFLSKRNVFTTHIHMHTHTHLPLSFNYIFHIPSLWSETKENPATLTSIWNPVKWFNICISSQSSVLFDFLKKNDISPEPFHRE